MNEARRNGEFDIFELAAGDSHFLTAIQELKSPLSVVRQLSLTLSDENIDISDTDRQRILRQMDAATERALRMVSDLVKISSLEGAMFELSPVNPRKVCDDVVRQMGEVCRLNRRSMTLKGVKSTDLVVANSEILRSAVLNLSENALSSSEGGEIELEVRAKGDKVRISVRNYGEEMPLKVWREVRESKTLAFSPKRPQNSALGLYIARSFTRAIGGEIGLIRHRDGNTFYIDLNKSEQLSLL